MTDRPLCPITGKPARRRIQWVSVNLLIDLWRYEFKVDARASFKGVTRIGLWESPTGLYFFDPMLEGDSTFYQQLYARLATDRFPQEGKYRAECDLAALHVKDGDRVLDVGCGHGAFRHVVPKAHYTGLDPHFGAMMNADWARAETLPQHLEKNAGAYDVACAFQVLEHVSQPVEMLRDMAAAVRPGGKIVIGVPHVPSAHTRIPNFMISALPHHLTWWTEKALLAAARQAGLKNASVEVAAWSRIDSLVYWIERCSLIRCRDMHFRHSWRWHASALLGFWAGYVMWKLRPAPRPVNDAGAGLLLVASVPMPPRAAA